MSRLLFAAARGARIEYKGGYSNWREAEGEYKSLRNHPDLYRIHPDDEHLQYGPISTTLLAMAQDPKRHTHVWPDLPPYFGFSVLHYTHEERYKLLDSSELDHSIFLLILAEALADEGS